MSEYNRHHCLFPRTRWSSGARKQVREHELSIVTLDIEEHNRLHHDLRQWEERFYPRARTILGMLALAEYEQEHDENPKSLEAYVERLTRWQEIAAGNGDVGAAHMLYYQIPYIERGYYGE